MVAANTETKTAVKPELCDCPRNTAGASCEVNLLCTILYVTIGTDIATFTIFGGLPLESEFKYVWNKIYTRLRDMHRFEIQI